MATLREWLAAMPEAERGPYLQSLYERRARILDDQRKGKVLGPTSRFGKGVGAGLANAAWGAVTLPVAVTNAVGLTEQPIRPLFGSGIGLLGDDPTLSGNAYRLGEFGGFLGSFFIGAGEARAGASGLAKLARLNPIARAAEVGGSASAKLLEQVGLKQQLIQQAGKGAGSLAAGEFVATPGEVGERTERAIGALPAGAVFGAFHATRGVRTAEGLHTSPAAIQKATKGMSVQEALNQGVITGQESAGRFVMRSAARGAAAGAVLGHGSPVEITGNPRLDSTIFNAGFFGASAYAHRGTTYHPERAKAAEATDAKRRQAAEDLDPQISQERDAVALPEHGDVLRKRVSEGEAQHIEDVFRRAEADGHRLHVVGLDTYSNRLLLVNRTTGETTTVDPRGVTIERPLTLTEQRGAQARMFEEAWDILPEANPPGVDLMPREPARDTTPAGQMVFDFTSRPVEQGGVIVAQPNNNPYVIPDPGARPQRQGELFGSPGVERPTPAEPIDLTDPIAKGELEARYESAEALRAEVPLPEGVTVSDTPFGPKIELPKEAQDLQYKLLDALGRVTARASNGLRKRPPKPAVRHTEELADRVTVSGDALDFPLSRDVRNGMTPTVTEALKTEKLTSTAKFFDFVQKLVRMGQDGPSLARRVMQPFIDVVHRDIARISPSLTIPGDGPLEVVIRTTYDRGEPMLASWNPVNRTVSIDPRYFAYSARYRADVLRHELTHDRTLLYEETLSRFQNPTILAGILDRMGLPTYAHEYVVIKPGQGIDVDTAMRLTRLNEESRMSSYKSTALTVLERLGVFNRSTTFPARQGNLLTGEPSLGEVTTAKSPETIDAVTAPYSMQVVNKDRIQIFRADRLAGDSNFASSWRLINLKTRTVMLFEETAATGTVGSPAQSDAVLRAHPSFKGEFPLMEKTEMLREAAKADIEDPTGLINLHEVRGVDGSILYVPITEASMSAVRTSARGQTPDNKIMGPIGDHFPGKRDYEVYSVTPHWSWFKHMDGGNFVPMGKRFYGYTNPMEFMAELATEFTRRRGNVALMERDFPGFSRFVQVAFGGPGALRTQGLHNHNSAQMELIEGRKTIEYNIRLGSTSDLPPNVRRMRANEMAEMVLRTTQPGTPSPRSTITVKSAASERPGVEEKRIPVEASKVSESDWAEHVRGFGLALNDPTNPAIRTKAEIAAGAERAAVRPNKLRADGTPMTKWDLMIDARAGKGNDAAAYHIEGAMQAATDLMMERIDPATGQPYTRTPNVGQMLKSLETAANRAAQSYKEQTEGTLADRETAISQFTKGDSEFNRNELTDRIQRDQAASPEDVIIGEQETAASITSNPNHALAMLREQLQSVRPGSLSYEHIRDQVYNTLPKETADRLWAELTGEGRAPAASEPAASTEPPAPPRGKKGKAKAEPEPEAVIAEPEVTTPEADTPAITIDMPADLRLKDLNTRRVHWLTQAFAEGLKSFEAATRNWKPWQRMAVLMQYGPFYKDANGQPLFPAAGYTKNGSPKRRTALEIGRHLGMVNEKADGAVVKSATVARWLASGFLDPVLRSPHDPAKGTGGRGGQRRRPDADTLAEATGEGVTSMAEALEAAFWKRVEANGGKIPNLMHERIKDIQVEDLVYTDPVTKEQWRADMTLAEMSDAIARRVAAEREAGIVDPADLSDKPTPESPAQAAAHDAIDTINLTTNNRGGSTSSTYRLSAFGGDTTTSTGAIPEPSRSTRTKTTRSREQILKDLAKGKGETSEYARRKLALAHLYQHGMKYEHFEMLTPTERLKHTLWSLNQATGAAHYTKALQKYAGFFKRAGVEMPTLEAVAAAKGHKERVSVVNAAERSNFVDIEIVGDPGGGRPRWRIRYQDSGKEVLVSDVGTVATLLDLRREQIRNAPELIPEAKGVTLDLKGEGPRGNGPPEDPNTPDAETAGEPPGHSQALERGIGASLLQSIRSPREWAYTFARKMNDPQVASIVNRLLGATQRMYSTRSRWVRRLNLARRRFGVAVNRGEALGKAMTSVDMGAGEVFKQTQSVEATRRWVEANERRIFEEAGLDKSEIAFLEWVRKSYLDRLANIFGLADRKWPGYFPRLRKRQLGTRVMEDTGVLTTRSTDFFAEYERSGLKPSERLTDLWAVLETYTGAGFRAKFVGSRSGQTGLIDELNDVISRYSPTDPTTGAKSSTPPSWLSPLLQVKRAALGQVDPRRAQALDKRDARMMRQMKWAEELADRHQKASYPMHEVVADLLRSRARRLGAELEANNAMLMADYFLSLNRARTFGLHMMRSIRHVTQSWFTVLPRVGPKVFFEVVSEMSTPQGYKRIMRRAIAAGAIKTPYEVDVSPSGDISTAKFSTKMMRAVDSLSKGYSVLDRWERGIAFEAQRRRFSTAAQEFKGHQNLEQLRVDSGLSMLHPMVWRQIEPLVTRGNFAAAERMAAVAMVDHAIFDYTRGNAPQWAAGVWGKVLGQYGRWPLNMVENFKGMLKYGTRTQKTQVLANYAAVAAAVYGIGQALGVKTGDWIPFVHAINYSGGPGAGLMFTGLDLLSGDETTKRRIYADFQYDPVQFILGGLFRQIMPAGDVLEALAAEANHTRREGLKGVIFDTVNLGTARQRRFFGVNMNPVWDIKTDDSLMGRHEGQAIFFRRLAGFRPTHDPVHRKPLLKEALFKTPVLGPAILRSGDVIGSVSDLSAASAAGFERRAKRANRVPIDRPGERLRGPR